MAETAAGRNTPRNTSPQPRLPWAPPPGGAWSCPLPACAKKELETGPESLLSPPGGEKGTRGKLPPILCSRRRGGTFCPRSPCTLPAAPVGPACQLLCREGRWNEGVFHPEPRCRPGSIWGEGKRTDLLPPVCFGKLLLGSSNDLRL